MRSFERSRNELEIFVKRGRKQPDILETLCTSNQTYLTKSCVGFRGVKRFGKRSDIVKIDASKVHLTTFAPQGNY